MKNGILAMIGRRIVQSVIILFIVTLIVFLLMQLVPGDPIVNFLGPNATTEQIEYYTELYGYDQPVLVQYSSGFPVCFTVKWGTRLPIMQKYPI